MKSQLYIGTSTLGLFHRKLCNSCMWKSVISHKLHSLGALGVVYDHPRAPSGGNSTLSFPLHQTNSYIPFKTQVKRPLLSEQALLSLQTLMSSAQHGS